MSYKWCVVPQCKNTSLRNPEKVFVSVPTNAKRRNKWLQLARRDPTSISSHTNVFMCEDHFDMSSLKELAVQLFDAGAVRLGDIEAKLGRRTPIYFDLRVVVSYPKIMVAVAQQLQKMSEEINHDLLCGVPYAALPMAAVMSINTNTPMIMKRKETKLYGTKKMLEGKFEDNQRCLVVEDVVTSGGSLMETVCALRSEGLKVTDAVVVLDRDQGGVSVLNKNGITVKSLFTLTDLLKILNEAGKINDETEEIILEHIKECQFSNLDFMKDNLELI